MEWRRGGGLGVGLGFGGGLVWARESGEKCTRDFVDGGLGKRGEAARGRDWRYPGSFS